MAAEHQPAISNRLVLTTVDALLGYAARATWPAGFVIYQRGAPSDGVFVVLEGRVILRSRVRAGRGFIPWIATHGETFGAEGLSATPRYSTEARADEEAATLFLSSARYRSFLREQPQHATALIAQILSERSALLEKLRELTTMSVEQRLIVALVRMATFDTFTRDDGCIVLNTNRYRLLCELVGATRESVSLVLGRFTGEGIIERKGNSLIVPAARLIARMEELPLDDLLAASVGSSAGVTSAGTATTTTALL
jgi:CRP/FNR family transcriptional regulator, cyclic AMP receptor protein